MGWKKMTTESTKEYTGWVLEITPGNFLKKVLEGGDFIDTDEITEAKMVDNEESLVNIVDSIYFSEVPGYPKFHRVRLVAEIEDTISYDDIA